MTATYGCCEHCRFDCPNRYRGHDLPCPGTYCPGRFPETKETT